MEYKILFLEVTWGHSSAGGIVRHLDGHWPGDFSHNIGICSSVISELWDLKFGLELMWSLGYRCVIVEVDLEVVHVLISSQGLCALSIASLV